MLRVLGHQRYHLFMGGQPPKPPRASLRSKSLRNTAYSLMPTAILSYPAIVEHSEARGGLGGMPPHKNH